MRTLFSIFASLLSVLLIAGNVAASKSIGSGVAEAVQTLEEAFGEPRLLVFNPGTGTVRLLIFESSNTKRISDSPVVAARAFFVEHSRAFGISDAESELTLSSSATDTLGFTHVSFTQNWGGIPVFGATLRTHFDSEGRLKSVNGAAVPGCENVNPIPSVQAQFAETVAEAAVNGTRKSQTGLRFEATGSALVMYCSGLARGVPGDIRLAWQVDVSDGSGEREIVFVDAHNSHLLDRMSGTRHIHRRIDYGNYERTIWEEGDDLPYRNSSLSSSDEAEINRLISVSQQIYDLFFYATGGGMRSYDGNDAPMISLQRSSERLMGAGWNGRYAWFCSHTATDDVIGHEWAHAYTEHTHNLINMWQPGALSEAYSNIIGEAVDLFTEASQGSQPGVRDVDTCSYYGCNSTPILEILDPSRLASIYWTGGATFNPGGPWSVTAEVELVDDVFGDPADACEFLDGFTPGRIALVEEGTCSVKDKYLHVQSAGAAGMIYIQRAGHTFPASLNDDVDGALIPVVVVMPDDGDALRGALAEGIEASLRLLPVSSSDRWIIGEDYVDLADLRNPGCCGDPVSMHDRRYSCSATALSTNSGVPSNAFALLMDGGSIGGYNITNIDLTRALNIYLRAMLYYQVPSTDFADHADLIELSCDDLVDLPLPLPFTCDLALEKIKPNHCEQLKNVMLAVGMRDEPAHCDFAPLLAGNPPPHDDLAVVYSERFDTDPGTAWQRSNQGKYPEYEPRDWQWTTELPAGGESGAFFAIDGITIGDCYRTDDYADRQTGVMFLESPEIHLPADGRNPVLTFDHYVATEGGYDGGNLKISVNGSPFNVVDNSEFLHNPYNRLFGSTYQLSSQWVFSGSDDGVTEGSWGQSQIDLSDRATGGDAIRLRFDFAVDSCNGLLGWYVDNIRVLMVPGPTPRRAAGRH